MSALVFYPAPCVCDVGVSCVEHGPTWSDAWLTPAERKAVSV